ARRSDATRAALSRKIAASDGEIRLELARVEDEERITRLHRLSHRDEDLTDDAAQRSANGDVLAVGLDEADRRDGLGEVRDWRGSGGAGFVAGRGGAGPRGHPPHSG